MDANLLRSRLDALEGAQDGLAADIRKTPEAIVDEIVENLSITIG
jgi:hypothetical protein